MTASQLRIRNRIAGFTLIEALVATALMATILAALATITAQWLPNWNRGMSRVQGDEDLALGLDRFVADLAAAEFAPAGPQTITPLFDGTSQSVTFVRTTLAPNTHPGLEIVRFAEINNANAPVLVRTQAPFEADGMTNREQVRFADPVALVRGPYRISLSYAGADRVWRDTWEQENLLPRAVRVTVRDEATRRALAVSTTTLLHVEAPSVCISANTFANCLASSQQPSAGAGTAAIPNPGQNP
jgi:general secretion pathway protein J